MTSYFIAGIDTEVGKTVVTGLLGRWFLRKNANVGTMKIVETGVLDGVMSQDIHTHRTIMGIEPLDVDIDGTTCPYRFRLPASPHLSASLENREILAGKIVDAAEKLQKRFDVLLIEGVGGLLVPLTRDYSAIEFVQKIACPVILVTSARLGSINHTLLSLEALAVRKIPLAGLAYNHYGNRSVETTDEIRRDTLDFFHRRLEKLGRPGALVEIPAFQIGAVSANEVPAVDFSALFE